MNQPNTRTKAPASRVALGPSILPRDTITCCHWLDSSRFGVTSFDGSFRLFELSPSRESGFALAYHFQYRYPLTCFEFLRQTKVVALGTADGKLAMVHLRPDGRAPDTKFLEVRQMRSPVSKLFYVRQNHRLICVDASGSFCVVDLRDLTSVFYCQPGAEILASDFSYPMLAVATDENRVEVMDIRSTKWSVPVPFNSKGSLAE